MNFKPKNLTKEGFYQLDKELLDSTNHLCNELVDEYVRIMQGGFNNTRDELLNDATIRGAFDSIGVALQLVEDARKEVQKLAKKPAQVI